MQIIHEEAKRLIQTGMDDILSLADSERLNEHLQVCSDCRAYMSTTKETEKILKNALQKQWGMTPLPLRMETVYAKIISPRNKSELLTTRRLLIGLVTTMFTFMVWQSVSISFQQNHNAIPLIPTPTSQYTATNTLKQDECNDIRYLVQDDDTLDSITHQFLITKEQLLHANNLETETLFAGQELVVPVCKSTPTSTTHPPTFTITPIFEATGTSSG